MTDERLNEIAARAEKATPGPWGEGAPGNPRVYGPINNKGDRSFIAHSRQDIPELLAEVKRLRLALEAAQVALYPLAEIPTSGLGDRVNCEFNWPISNFIILDARKACEAKS